MKAPGLAVYEALNHSRKEIFIGVTSRSLAEIGAVPRNWFPAEIAHWGAAEPLDIRGIAEGMPDADAWQFAALYEGYIERADWTIIRQKQHG